MGDTDTDTDTDTDMAMDMDMEKITVMHRNIEKNIVKSLIAVFFTALFLFSPFLKMMVLLESQIVLHYMYGLMLLR